MSKGIIEEYFFYHDKYTKIYGNCTFILMRVGDFYEAYATETRGFDLAVISEAANIIRTKKDKKIEKVENKLEKSVHICLVLIIQLYINI